MKTEILKSLLITFIFTILISSSAMLAFAAPDSIAIDAVSTAGDILNVKTPEGTQITTANRKLPISATANEGTVITIYRYNSYTGTYTKIWTGDTILESTVGATGLFATQAELNDGANKFLVRAAINENTYQYVRFEVTLVNETLVDKIKNIGVSIGGLLN